MFNIAALDAKYDIIILPMASEIPDSGFKSIAAQSKKLDKTYSSIGHRYQVNPMLTLCLPILYLLLTYSLPIAYLEGNQKVKPGSVLGLALVSQSQCCP
ncbi:hypothetical protein [Pedobacter psychrodurus]|uniref:hypothetical protein n=1 Tax=Pedobacter psychrodurus TaxID=2530456 RepID=UPI00292F8DFA|nr:hypothetical protein [Pedobacter psychrodurus]